MSDLDEDVEGYARFAMTLATSGEEERVALLAAHDLDETSFGLLEDRWLRKLSAAEDAQEDGIPPLLLAFAEAFAQAQREQGGDGVMPLARYALITRSLSRGRDVAQVLEKQGLSLGDYLRSHQHWAIKLATDPDLAQRFHRLLMA